MTNDLNIVYVDVDAVSVVISAPAESPSVFIPESAEPVAVFSNLNAPGAPGPSAYQIALAAAPPFVGTEAEWLASLVGVPGPSNITSSTTTDLDGLAKFDGAHVGTAIPGVDYMLPTGSGAGLTSLSKTQVGLNLADNTPDTDKPVSTPQQTALDSKVGHSLATAANDFLVASGAGVFIKKTLAEVKTILGLGSAAYAAVSDFLSPTGNGSGLTGLTKTQVGLGSVQNLDQRDASNINTGTMDGDRLPAMSTAKRGGVPATGTPSGRILSDGDIWIPMGNGDVSSDTLTTVDGEIALFKGTAGKTIQRTSMTGMLKAVAGKLYAAVAGTDYVTPNTAIAPGTGTKVTYDAKGLVTSSTAATTADIADSNDRRYCTEAEKTIIGNTSGNNSGDISKATGAEVTTGTDDAKFATPKAIKDAGIVATPVKATGAEVTTGTDDAKFATAKALADAGIKSLNVQAANVATSETTASGTYANLTTPGPAVTLTTGTSVIIWFAVGTQRVGAYTCYASVNVSGATTIAASDANGSARSLPSSGNNETSPIGRVLFLTGLTPGSNTFTLKYRTDSSQTFTFYNRSIAVLAL